MKGEIVERDLMSEQSRLVDQLHWHQEGENENKNGKRRDIRMSVLNSNENRLTENLE